MSLPHTPRAKRDPGACIAVVACEVVGCGFQREVDAHANTLLVCPGCGAAYTLLRGRAYLLRPSHLEVLTDEQIKEHPQPIRLASATGHETTRGGRSGM